MLRAEANDCQYLFLGGIMGEVLALPFVGNYLKVNRKILRDLGVEHIECLTLNSYKSAIDNSLTLVKVIERLYKEHGKPLVIIGHSKGSLELIFAMMHDLSVFKEKVKKIICVQPPFQGSSVVGKMNLLKYANPFWPGLKCLEVNHHLEIFDKKLNTNSEVQKYMRDHLLVIRGYKTKTRNVSWIIRPSHFVLKKRGLFSDGLVTLNDQILPFAEYQEIVMDIDHSDIFTSTLLSNRNDDYRKKVMSDLINWVIDSELPTTLNEEFAQPLANLGTNSLESAVQS